MRRSAAGACLMGLRKRWKTRRQREHAGVRARAELGVRHHMPTEISAAAQLALMPPDQPAWAARFWAKVDTSDPDGCWPWLGRVATNGYGSFSAARKSGGAHRFSYELAYGPIPPELTIDHTCHNRTPCAMGKECPHRRCQRPDHLEAVTMRVNTLRGKTIPAANARKQACPLGHPFKKSRTRRNCPECMHRYREAHRQELRAAQRLYDDKHRDEIAARKRASRAAKKLAS